MKIQATSLRHIMVIMILISAVTSIFMYILSSYYIAITLSASAIGMMSLVIKSSCKISAFPLRSLEYFSVAVSQD